MQMRQLVESLRRVPFNLIQELIFGGNHDSTLPDPNRGLASAGYANTVAPQQLMRARFGGEAGGGCGAAGAAFSRSLATFALPGWCQTTTHPRHLSQRSWLYLGAMASEMWMSVVSERKLRRESPKLPLPSSTESIPPSKLAVSVSQAKSQLVRTCDGWSGWVLLAALGKTGSRPNSRGL